MFMETGDICVSYRDAKDKREQIKILADLNACKVCEIEKILVENGFEIPMRKGVKKEASKRKNTQKLTWDRQLVETFTVDMGKATNENLTLRKELNAVREELSQRTDVLFKKNIKGLAHLVLCGLKKLSEGHSPYDADMLDGAMVGVANMILELDAE